MKKRFFGRNERSSHRPEAVSLRENDIDVVYTQPTGFATLLRIVKEMILPYNRNMVKACLLFVEADIDVSNMTIIYFAGMGWDVYPAASGSDALKIASQVSPHLIILDKVEYEPLSVTQYEQRYREQQLKYLQKKAAKFGFQLTPT